MLLFLVTLILLSYSDITNGLNEKDLFINCGSKYPRVALRVDNGIPVNKFPWSVSLQYHDKNCPEQDRLPNGDCPWFIFCGGSLIYNRYVLTISHCYEFLWYDPLEFRAVLGCPGVGGELSNNRSEKSRLWRRYPDLPHQEVG